MGETMSDGTQPGSGAGFDLSQFYQVFFEEAGENLANMETLLLEVDVSAPTDEELNAIFRCAHSIKGGAATFGFADVAELTHEMETLLDKLRRHELAMTTPMVDTLLSARDALGSLLARHQGSSDAVVDTRELVETIRAMAHGEVQEEEVAAAAAAAVDSRRTLEVTVGPLENLALADHLVDLFNEIPDLGSIEALDGGVPVDGKRVFQVKTGSPDGELLDLFSFHVSREQVAIRPLGASQPTHAEPAKDPGYGFFTDVEAGKTMAAGENEAGENERGYGFFVDPDVLPIQTQPKKAAPSAPPPAPKAAAKAETRANNSSNPESSTIRVSVEKVDQLINLVGELVITQAMLAQIGRNLDPVENQNLMTGLSDLERNTRHLQESVMSIRMIPMAFVFNRFPRMLRDLAAKLGKQVELQTVGEATELDKGLIEKITDPLTHLVRNSVDHGIEKPEDRIASGKPAQGKLTLSAAHQGGSIVIEVRDDGRGLNRDKILSKAKERGLPVQDNMSDQDVWQLIFEPGFSTADQVTDVSGRGVGMDVVKRNIAALGGSVELDSAEGYGTRVSVRLPLTLAIMDGMSVSVGEETYILPLGSVIESFQMKPNEIKTIGASGRVVEVRSEFMPVVALEEVFNVPRFDFEKQSGIMIVVEAEGSRIALLVDELLGQHQVVVKNLETNYRKVAGVSGATILGDGRVALILDIGSLIKRSRH
jgi:two-component system chemotaxis sensor kinase CheA